jgi:DNA gyrase subunit B
VSKGKTAKYAFSDQERDQIIADLLAAQAEKEAADKDKKVKGKSAQAKKTDVVTAEDLAAYAETAAIAEEDEADVAENPIKKAGISIQRYKGLGEMNADQLWETTMDPNNRVLLKVTVADAEKADSIFNKLMGEEVALRKNFIQTHAKSVSNLDI